MDLKWKESRTDEWNAMGGGGSKNKKRKTDNNQT